MKGTIYLVPFGTQGATEFLLKQAMQLISGNDFTNILYLGPTPRKIRDAQIAFTKLVSVESFIPPRFFTIKQYTNELFCEYNRDYKRLADYLKPLLIQKLKPEISINYAKLIAEFIRESKQYLTDFSDAYLEQTIFQELIINKSVDPNDKIYQRIQEALAIRQQYNQTLAEKKYLDAEDIGLQSLSFITNYEQIKILVLDGFFYDLTKLEEKIVTTLINRAEKVYALSFYDERLPSAYALPQEFLVFLRRLNLFQEEKINKTPEIRTDLPYYVCPSIEDEVEFIASKIKYEFLNNNLDLNRTIVTFPRLNEYEVVLCRIFDKYQIPYSIDTTKVLSKSQPVIPVLELLRAILNDYPRLETVSVLSSKYFQRFSQETKEMSNYFSKKAGIIKSANHWKTLNKTLTAIFNEEKRLTKDLEKLINIVQDDINTLLKLSEKLNKQSATLSEFSQALSQLLAQLQWCQNEIDDETATIKNEFYKVLGVIENFESDFGEMMVQLADYLKILEHFLDHTELLPEIKTGGVSVLGFLETRGLDCDHLFFGGLSEEGFPGQMPFDPILPEWLKQKLQMPSLETHLMRMRFHYFRLINTARRDTILSYYNTDQDRLFLPSPFLTGEAKPPEKYDAIFSLPQQQQARGRQDNIDATSFITPVDFTADQEAQAILNARFGPKTKISVTTIEGYARCPYKFYLENILGIKSLKEPAYQIEPTLWGIIAHQVFAKLYENGPVPIDQIPAIIRQILKAVLKEKNLSQFWQNITIGIFENFLRYFIKMEQNLRNQGFQPEATEVYLSAKISADITITGKVDRLDKNLQNQLLILDYKTGKGIRPTKNAIASGAHLQLPLYAFLVLNKYRNCQVANAGLYSVVDNEIAYLLPSPKNPPAQNESSQPPTPADKVISDQRELNDLINLAIDKTKNLIRALRQGQFSSPPINNPCYNCDYLVICPIRLKNEKATKN